MLLNEILYVIDNYSYNYYRLFYALLVNRYNDRLLPLLGIFFLIQNRINYFKLNHTNALDPFKSASDERTKWLRCTRPDFTVRSC